MLPITANTSFSDLAVSFEVWIFMGIFIIMNSKSPKDSALKCFIFFLISQPLVYLIQDVITHSRLFITYYKYWFILTILTIPMGFIGYYMKKNKWWGLLILAPMLLLVGKEYSNYLAETMFSFPRHLLTTLFCLATMIIYPIAIFKDKKIKIAGVVCSILIILIMTVLTILNPQVYRTTLVSNGGSEGIIFDDTYKVYLADESYKAGKTEVIIESPDGEKTVFDITIKKNTYDLTKK